MEMTIVSLVVAVVALLVAFFALRRAGSVQERLERTSAMLYELRGALNETNEKLDEKINDLRLNLRRQAGETIFRPEMTIAEAMDVHPKVRDVLASFHLGGCSNCAVSDVDTIQGACQSYGVDQRSLMEALNNLTRGDTVGPVKAPNVKVSF